MPPHTGHLGDWVLSVVNRGDQVVTLSARRRFWTFQFIEGGLFLALDGRRARRHDLARPPPRGLTSCAAPRGLIACSSARPDRLLGSARLDREPGLGLNRCFRGGAGQRGRLAVLTS